MELNRTQKIAFISKYYHIPINSAALYLYKAERQHVSVACIKAVEDYQTIMALLSFYNEEWRK